MIRHEVRFYAEFLSMRQVADCYNDWREALAPMSGTLLEHPMRESTRSIDSIDEVGLRETAGRCAIHLLLLLLQNNGLRAAAARFWLRYGALRAGGTRPGGLALLPSRNLAGKACGKETEGSARRR